jgi:hypothetical protein
LDFYNKDLIVEFKKIVFNEGEKSEIYLLKHRYHKIEKHYQKDFTLQANLVIFVGYIKSNHITPGC